uniref:Uncharacterized protein n=1 Tax=Schistosoma japonicum TaxID=6182 RepID=Q5C5G7_SCHJA|nr:unknown [Schistosoma japonicum]
MKYTENSILERQLGKRFHIIKIISLSLANIIPLD